MYASRIKGGKPSVRIWARIGLWVLEVIRYVRDGRTDEQ